MNKIKAFIPGLSRVISNATPVIIIFVLSKFVDPSELGVVNYFISLITLVGVLTDFGLPETVQRFIPQDKSGKLIFPSILFEFVLVLVGANAFAIADMLTGGKFSYGNTLLMFFILIFSSSNIVTLVFNSLGYYYKASVYFLGSSLSFILITFGLYFGGITDLTQSFLIGRLISWIIFTILPLWSLYKGGFLKVAYKLPKRMITFAFNSFVFVFSYSTFNQWDSILITNTMGEYSNGIYKSVSFIASLPYVLSVVLDTKQLPEYSKMFAEKKYKELMDNCNKYTKGLLALAVVLTILSIPLSRFGLSIIFNSEIADNGYFYLPLILLAVMTYVASIPSVNVLQASGNEAKVRNVALVQSVGFVILSTLLLPSFGLIILPLILIGLNATFLTASFISARRVKFD